MKERLASLSPGRAQLLERVLAKQSAQPQKIASPPGEPDEAGVLRFLMSFAQQRLWFIEQLGGAGATYNIPLIIRLQGTLNEPALRSALNGLVARHEVLR